MVLKVFRWSPGSGERLQRFWVPAREGMTVLDALVDAQRRLDPTLAFRYACRVGMCGSCGMVINGRERWACRTLLKSLKAGIVTVRPLYHFPLIRDLVVDMAPLAEQTARVGAAFVPRTDPPAFARIPAAAPERERIDPAIECIGCGMCVSACTMVANDERFPGPAALNRLFTLQQDSRDAARPDRSAVMLSEDTLMRCHTETNCTDVCPMSISPTQSILALRRRAVWRLFG
ncbi:MAG TPA: succinate dehydrogenase/fumarate reductase iron-sulfur subunit [Candidatus Dormibacteraeota bacterium]|jgi:succinate dehydrogenase/fumarate reductase iron-sulfur protein|nr:succinate dehydrogenase/fumarate reductase iron-sulfur subunit [Candidatus Dormibacteraeota bacterium]